MKKSIAILTVALSVLACNTPTETKEFKVAYVDTSKLMENYTQAKDIDAKYKSKAEEMGKELQVEAQRFQNDAKAFEEKARQLGQIWAQQNSGPLQQRQQRLQMAQQSIMRQLQEESAVEMDTLVNRVKRFIKGYGSENGYDYILGTGDAATVLYAKDAYDMTDAMTKARNEKYAAGDEPEGEKKPADTTATE